MKFEDSIRLSFHIFRRNRLRTALTVFAVAVGVGVIVFLISLGYGLQRLTIERIASAASLKSMDVTSADPGKPLNDALVEAFKALEGVAKVEAVIQLPGLIETDNELIDVTLWGISDDFFELEGLSFATGKSFSDQGAAVSKATVDLLGFNPDAAIGKTLSLSVFPQDGSTADSIKIGDDLVIDGVIQESLSPAIYLAGEKLSSYHGGQYHLLKVVTDDETKIQSVKEKITALGYQAQATLDDVDALKQGFKIARIVLGVFGLVALFVSSIGMLNTMTISLLERIKEIGVMKALGASDKDVWTLFLTEASLIGAMGGLAGLALGYLGGVLFNFAFNIVSVKAGGPIVDLFVTPLAFSIGMFLFAVIVGIVTGVYPARRASKLNPLEALRYE